MKPQDPNSQPKNKPQNLVNLPEHIIKTATMWTLSSAYVISLILGNCLERITRETDTLTENKVARHQTPVHERVGGGGALGTIRGLLERCTVGLTPNEASELSQ